jgi:2-keto-3-deoxy-L-rhamnonate aldolase RhmA
MAPILRQNKLKELLKKGRPTIGTHVHSSSPGTIEVIGNSGTVDYVEFTSTYAPFDLYALENLARASELYDMSTMIKIDPQPNYFLAQRAIGSGFQNVLFADLRSVEEVEDAVKAVRPAPRGWNGCSMHRIEGYLLEPGTKDFEKYANDIVIAVMVEKKSLYEKMEEVMNIDDVGMIQFGPCDFAMELGVHGQFTHPKVLEAEAKTIKMALKYDKHPRAELSSYAASGPAGFQKKLKKYMELGVRDYCIGTDVVILFEWMRQYVEITKKALKAD